MEDKRQGLVLVRGGGDLASGVSYRLYMCGFTVIIVEKEKPTVVRRAVSFANAAFDGKSEVEGIECEKVLYPYQAYKMIEKGKMPLLIDPDLKCLERKEINPEVLVEGTMAKKNTGIARDMAKKVIALGPGFCAGRDVDAVVETARGHYLGRVIYEGFCQPNTGIPGKIEGYTRKRVIRAPRQGRFKTGKEIGQLVERNETIGYVDHEPVKAEINGMIRGLLKDGLKVKNRMKLGDIDPRSKREYCFTISDKAFSVGGGVLEAIFGIDRLAKQ